MAKKKATPAKRKYVKKAVKQSTIAQIVQPFEIETEPPSFRLNPDLAHTLKRVEATIKFLKPGQAFVVPSKSKHTIKKFIEERWPLCHFMYSIIKDNQTNMRIYFVKKLDN